MGQGRTKRKFFQERNWNKLLAKPGAFPFIVVLDGLKPNYNVAKTFRSAQAFGAQAIYLVGLESFNPYPAKGAVRYVPFKQFPDFASCLQTLEADDYSVFALSATSAEESLPQTTLPLKSAFVLGHEEFGLSFNPQDYPGRVRPLGIPIFGSIESLNVSNVASILMFEYVRQHFEIGRVQLAQVQSAPDNHHRARIESEQSNEHLV